MSLTALTTHNEFEQNYCGAPIYYYSKQKQKEFIILCPDHRDHDGLLQYDIEENKWISFAPFPDDFRPSVSYFTIDPQNELIYVFSGFADKVFGIYSLINNKWNNIKKCSMTHFCGACCFIAENMNQIHVFGTADRISCNHLIYNDIPSTFSIASKNGINNNCLNVILAQGMVYISVRRILISAGGARDFDCNGLNDDIWYIDITQKPKSNYKWKVLGKLPINQKGITQCAVVFGAVLLIIIYIHFNNEPWGSFNFNGGTHTVWCADMALNTIKWRKCNVKVPNVKRPYYVVIAAKSQFVHFMHAKNYHSKMHLSRLLPEDIYAKYAPMNVIYGKQNDDKEYKCNECDLWKTKYEESQSLIEQLLSTNTGLQSENVKMKKENITLNEECKEIQMQLKEMKKRKGFNIDPSRFMEWNYDDVVDWIISLDSGRFGEKEQSLRKTFSEEEINGVALPHIDQADIKEWGFTKFKDKKDLLKHIQTLVAQNTAKMNANEGKNITSYI